MKNVFLVLLLFPVLAFSQSDEKIELTQLEQKVSGLLSELATKERAKLCFEHSRLMIFGAYQNELGRPIDTFVRPGALVEGEVEYELVSRGYKMNGVMGNQSRDYFLECLDAAK